MSVSPGYTPYQAAYFAHFLTREGLDGDGLTQSLSAARVDLNPHQVEAAMFAMRSPLSKGVLLAVEVGLGKTIEAALVISQRWWERRRRLLLITPASLRKQWAQELHEKFSLPSVILDSKRVKDLAKAGKDNPLGKAEGVVILSYEYAARIAEDILAADPLIRRTRSRLVPVIAVCAADRGEERPGFTTVLSWLSEWERFGGVYGTAAYCDRHDLKGKSGGRLAEYQEQAIVEGIEAWFALRSKAKAYAIVCEAVQKFDEREGVNWDKASLPPGLIDEKGRLRPPSTRTFERRCNTIDRMTQDWAIKGPAYAKQKNRTYQKPALPERPYQHVDVDNHTVDIIGLV